MKKVIFILFILLSFGCKKHKDDPKPAYKDAALKIEYSDSHTSNFYSGLWLNVGNSSLITKHFPETLSTTHSLVLDTIVKSGQSMSFGANPTFSNGSAMVYGAYHIKVTFNGVQLADESFPNASGVAVNLTLPKIE